MSFNRKEPKMGKIFCILLGLAALIFLSNFSLSASAEHPGASHREHPGEHQAEHPGEKTMLSAAQIIQGIKDHINEVANKNTGYFPIYDSVERRNLRLKLIRVHEDRVSYIKKSNAYFACTDFMAEDGKTKYDVDFWMKKGIGGKVEVYKTKIHKKDGNPRFTYQDDEIAPVE